MAAWDNDPPARAAKKQPWDDDPPARPKLTARQDRRAPDDEASPREQLRRKMTGGNFRGLGKIAGQNFAFGLGDEVAGLASGTSNFVVGGLADATRYVGRLMGAKPISDNAPSFEPVAAYDRGRDEYNADIERTRREVPQAALMADVAGIAGNIGMPVKAIAGARGLGSAVKAGVTQGAVAGTIAGFGNSEGGFANRLAGAAIGAGTGAALGAALPISVATAGSAIRGGMRMAGRGPSVAPQVVANALRADGGIARAGQRVADAQARGVPMALGDTGDNARGIMASVGRQPGEARTIVRDMAIARQEGQGERIAGAVARDLGPVANVRATSEALAAQAKQQAAPLYEAAYSAPIAITDELSGILRRLPPQAVANAKELARLEGRDPNAIGVDLDDLGQIKLIERPSMQTLDYIKRGLDDVVETFRDGTTGRLNLDTRGRATNDALRDFVSEVDRINPAYAQARAAYAGPMKMAAALKKGQTSLNATADDLLVMTRDLTPGEAEQFRLGLRSALIGRIEGGGDYADKVRQLVGTPKKRAALAQIFGGNAELDRFLATMADEADLGRSYQAVAGNSATAERQAFDAATGDQGLLNTAAGAATDVARGNVGAGVTRIIADLRNYGAGEAGKRARSEVAAALAETDPTVLRQALRDATRARNAERLRNSRGASSAVRQGQAAGSIGGGYVNRLLTAGEPEQ